MDFEERPVREQGHHQAHIEDITLPSANNFDQFGAIDPFDIGPSDGIGSQDFADLDLGINWGAEPVQNSDAMSVDGSVGVGRDAPSVHESFDLPHLNGIALKGDKADLQSIRSYSRDPSEQPLLPPMDMDFPDFGGMDLGDLGIGFDNPVEEPEAEKDKAPSSRACASLRNSRYRRPSYSSFSSLSPN
jgi:cohesin complex subunit SCC1